MNMGGLQQYQRKNKLSARKKYFVQRKGNVPPVVRGNTDLRGAAWIFTLARDK